MRFVNWIPRSFSLKKSGIPMICHKRHKTDKSRGNTRIVGKRTTNARSCCIMQQRMQQNTTRAENARPYGLLRLLHIATRVMLVLLYCIAKPRGFATQYNNATPIMQHMQRQLTRSDFLWYNETGGVVYGVC